LISKYAYLDQQFAKRYICIFPIWTCKCRWSCSDCSSLL